MKDVRKERTDRVQHDDADRAVERDDLAERTADLLPPQFKPYFDRLEAVVAQYPFEHRALVRRCAIRCLAVAETRDNELCDPMFGWTDYLFGNGLIPHGIDPPSVDFRKSLQEIERHGVFSHFDRLSGDPGLLQDAIQLVFRDGVTRDEVELLSAIDSFPTYSYSDRRHQYASHPKEVVDSCERLFERGGAVSYSVAFSLTNEFLEFRGSLSDRCLDALMAGLQEPWQMPPHSKFTAAEICKVDFRFGPDAILGLVLEVFSSVDPAEQSRLGIRLREALPGFVGLRRASAVLAWRRVTGSFDGSPFPIADVLAECNEPAECLELLLADDSQHDPIIVARVISACEGLSLRGHSEGIHRVLSEVVRVALDGGQVLPAVASLLTASGNLYQPSVADQDVLNLTLQWLGDYLRRMAEDRPGRTEWDAWVKTLRGQPRDALVWHVFADWLDERNWPDPACVARGQPTWSIGWEEVFARIAAS